MTVRATSLSPPNKAKKFQGKFPRDKYLTRTPSFTPIRGRTKRWVSTVNPNACELVFPVTNGDHLTSQDNINCNELSGVQANGVKEDIPDNSFLGVESNIVIDASQKDSFGVSEPEASCVEVVRVKKNEKNGRELGYGS